MKLFILATLLTMSLSCFSQNNALKESMERGHGIYTDFCMSCHLPNGDGVESVYPPLANSDYLLKNREASIRGIKFGQSRRRARNFAISKK